PGAVLEGVVALGATDEKLPPPPPPPPQPAAPRKRPARMSCVPFILGLLSTSVGVVSNAHTQNSSSPSGCSNKDLEQRVARDWAHGRQVLVARMGAAGREEEIKKSYRTAEERRVGVRPEAFHGSHFA